MKRAVFAFALFFAVFSRAEITLETLEAQEWELESRYYRLRASGLTAEAVARAFAQELANPGMAPADRRLLATAALDPRHAELSASLVDLQKRYATIDGAWSAFQDAYDRFNHDKVLFFVDRYSSAAEKLLAPRLNQLKAAAPGSDDHRLYQSYEQLRELQAQTKAILDQKPIGQGDARRMTYARHFAEKFPAFWEQAAAPQRTRWEGFAYRFESLRRWLTDRVSRALMGVEYLRAASLLKNNRPVLDAFSPGLERAFRFMGYSFEITGRRYIQNPPPSRTVRVYAPVHTHGLLDTVMTARLPLADGRLFLAPTFFAPQWMADAMETNDQFVCVATGGNDLRRFLRQMDGVVDDLEKGRCDSIYVHPEGSLATGLASEIRRPADSFVKGILSRVRSAGWQLEIVPISLPNHPRPWQDHLAIPTPHHLPIVIHEPLPPALTDLLLTSGNPQSLSRLIRQFWLDSAHERSSTRESLLGSRPVRKLTHQLDALLQRRTHCEGALLASGLRTL